MNTVAIKPAPGCRLILPEGGTTLDGVGIPPDADLPAEGAYVTRNVWFHKRWTEGDAILVDDEAVAAGARAAEAREEEERARQRAFAADPAGSDTPVEARAEAAPADPPVKADRAGQPFRTGRATPPADPSPVITGSAP